MYTIHNWYNNQTENLLFGIDTYQIVLYQWQNKQGQISCQTDNEQLVGQTFVYEFYSTVKSQINNLYYYNNVNVVLQVNAIKKEIIKMMLQVRIQQFVDFQQNHLSYQQNILVIICVGLGGALALSILAFACYRNKTQSQIFRYKEQLKKYDKFQGEINSESHGIRQATPHPNEDNKFRIDEEDQ